ncbi:MAG: Xaa-Pro dipeptidyl-peptidase, partial [Kutzneria sp.]|nr:Xaa-Pro dipeptidyl-peptidase [Kutzneria sp.]
TSSITVTATPSASSARLSAILVDLGPETIRNFGGTGEGITTLTTKSCWGDSSAGDSACYLDTKADTTNVSALAISRGWADLGHYASLDSQQPLTPGKAYTMTFSLASTDHVVPAGHRLALIIAGTDHEEITGGTGAPTVVIDLTGTTVKVPLVGTLPA